MLRHLPVQNHARSPAIPVLIVWRLWIYEQFHAYSRSPERHLISFKAHEQWRGGPLLSLTDPAVDFIAQAIVELETRCDLERVLKVEVVSLAPHSRHVKAVSL